MKDEKNKKYDYTSKTRQQRRRASLNRIANDLGFDTWGKLETALINGAVRITINHNEITKAE